MQSIFVYEYLPAFLGGVELENYAGYKPDVHPGISHMFQAAAFRFGHSLIPPGLMRRNGKCEYRKTAMGYPALRLCATWWDASVSTMKLLLLLTINNSNFFMHAISPFDISNNFQFTGGFRRVEHRRVLDGHVISISGA